MNSDAEFLDAQTEGLTDQHTTLLVSEWAESTRYLPPQATSMPGFYSYDVAPYLREIADCLSVDSPVRELDLMKGAQIGATVGIIENGIGYLIDHIKSAPSMLLTADAELAKLRVDTYVMPMIEYSGLRDLIRSSDENNTRKTGATSKKLEWQGGGYLVPFGAINANKLRSMSIMYLFEDEVDSYPERVGKDGDPQALAETRTKAYHQKRKIVRLSTPLVKGNSRIAKGFERGDQRYYFVPCRACGLMQKLEFRKKDADTGKIWGLVWSVDEDGDLVPDSSRYICEGCGHAHKNSDKMWMLPRGEWRATAKQRDKTRRSYHLNALYSPIGMLPWDAIATEWLEAWDDETNKVRDTEALQVFYNNNLGKPFEITGSKIRFASVSAHRRPEYLLGNVPNEYAIEHAGSRILMLICAVDVHKTNLAVSVMGVCRGGRIFLIDYWRFEDENCDNSESPVWGRLRELIEEKIYTADDGCEYKIALTLVDAGYANATVTDFCADYSGGVYAILGRPRADKAATIREFSGFKTQAGRPGYKIIVDHYKDRMAPVLRREWSPSAGPQPPFHFNAPTDTTEKQIKELITEYKREIRDGKTGMTHHAWYRPGNAPNELFDLLGYTFAGVDITAWSIFVDKFERDEVEWGEFWDHLEKDTPFFKIPAALHT